jgi:hypothetical protein
MPAIQVLQNQSQTLSIVCNSQTSSVAVTCYKPDGSELTSGSATVDSTLTTVQSQQGESPESVHVTSVSGFVVGRPYIIESQGGPTSILYLSEIRTSGSLLVFDAPPAFDLASGDTIRGARASFVLGSGFTGERDLYYRAEFTVTPSSGDVYKKQTIFHVCRTQFQDPVSLDDVKRVLSFQFPSSASAYQAGQLREMAERASNMVLRQIEASGKLPHLVSSPDAFKDAGLYALRLVLADDNLIPQAGTTEIVEYVQTMQKQMVEECRTAIKAGQWYDKNDDGVVDPRETGAFSTRVLL